MGGPYFGKVSEVSSNDPTAYLPESADATQVRKLLTEFSDSDTIPAIVVFTSEHELTDPHLDSIAAQLEQLPGSEGVLDGVSPALPSDDGKAVQAFVPIDSNADVSDAVGALGDSLRSAAPPGVSVYVTGPAGFSSDLSAAFSGIDGLLLGVALIAVFIILIIVYRSL
ncbi:MAG: MMPL family transporter, partial [Leucobacter sp.]|nr:MMPL family transporter [Leucobacter sp.]